MPKTQPANPIKSSKTSKLSNPSKNPNSSRFHAFFCLGKTEPVSVTTPTRSSTATLKNASTQVSPRFLRKLEFYSAFKNWCPTTSIWSFLAIFRIIFGQKIEIFKIALPARPSGSFYWAILKISIFWPKIILKMAKNDQISAPDTNF